MAACVVANQPLVLGKLTPIHKADCILSGQNSKLLSIVRDDTDRSDADLIVDPLLLTVDWWNLLLSE